MYRFSCDGMCRLIGGERRGHIGIVGYRGNTAWIEVAHSVGKATDDEAKFLSIITALTLAKRFNLAVVEIQLDSKQIVGQLLGDRITVRRHRELAMIAHRLSEHFVRVRFKVVTDLRAKALAWSDKFGERLF